MNLDLVAVSWLFEISIFLPAAAQNLCELSPTGMDTCSNKKIVKNTEKLTEMIDSVPVPVVI